MLFDEGADVGLELAGRVVHAALQLLSRQFGEPAFDLVDPESRGRREVDVPVRSPRQPGLDRCGLVSGVIVHDDVDVQLLGDAPVDLLQEVEELPRPVAPVALADNAARGDVEGIVRLIRLDLKNLQSRPIRLQVDATRPGRRLGLV